ncbi:MAG: class I mannose-6-phosphate isomerase [Bradymonadaceae bacterium]|nr:class I mannose-6-phosphate isomerase [Lujinxingiaceae bacterium]
MDSIKPYIFRMRPYLCEKVWGGRNLERLFDKPLPANELVGEAWEVADLPEGQSVVDSGALAGRTLGQLVALWGQQLTGSRSEGESFPLLVKILDAQKDLSIQVHPGDEQVGAIAGARSKDECWLVLDVAEGGSVLHGFSGAVDRASFACAVEQGQAVDLLRRIAVAPGDVIRVAPGTVHAICSGVVLLEMQQPSDTTYRVYDYGRAGLDGRPRPLHLEQALAVIDWEGSEAAQLIVERVEAGAHALHVLVDVPAYRVERLKAAARLRWRVDPGSVQIVFVLDGACRVSGRDGAPVELARGQTALIPACAGTVELVSHNKHAEVVVAGLGGHVLVDIVE